jgi:hypothetical protein
MFEAELKRAETKFDFIEQQSLKVHRIEWTLLDPSRVLQVLINFMTSAIKFKRTEEKRHVIITMGAYLAKPSGPNEFRVEFVQKSESNRDQTFKKG